MKKVLLFLLFFVPIIAVAQNPVIISAPYKFQKWVRVAGSLFSDSTIASGDSSNRVPPTAWVKRLFAIGITGYVPYTGATSNLNLGSHTITAQTLIGQLNYTHTAGYGITGSNFTNSANQTWVVDSTNIVAKPFFNTVIGTATLNRINTKQNILSGTGYSKFAGTSVSYVSAIPNADLANSSTTINGTPISLGASGTVTANTPNSVTFNNSGSGDASGTAFNGGTTRTISYNTIGASPSSGSGSYIQNGTSLQTSANFNISGSGTIGTQLSAQNGRFTGAYSTGTGKAVEVGVSGGDGLIQSVDRTGGGYNKLYILEDTTIIGNDLGVAPYIKLNGKVQLLSNLIIPISTASTTGVIYKNTDRFLHDYRGSGADGESVFLGRNAGNFTMSTGGGISSQSSYNTGLGVLALNSLTTGWSNVGVGYRALGFTTSGKYNTATGVHALDSTTTGDRNTAMGHYSVYRNSTGNENTGFGASTLRGNQTGSGNNMFGVEAGYLMGSTDANSAFGRQSLYFTTGSYNNAFGNNALRENTSGQENSAFGLEALHGNTTGTANVGFGVNAGETNSTGNRNIFLGYRSGYYETGSDKLFIDNRWRASEADGRKKAIIYGVLADSISNQSLTINASRLTVNSNTVNQNLNLRGNGLYITRPFDNAEIISFYRNTDLGSNGTLNILGNNGIQFRTEGPETVKATLSESGNFSVVGNLTATLPTYSTGTISVAGYSATNNRFETFSALPVANGGTNTGTAGIGAINNISGRSYSGFSGTGNLAGTAAPTFTSSVTLNPSTGLTGGFIQNRLATDYSFMQVRNNSGSGGYALFGVADVLGSGTFTGSLPYAASYGSNNSTATQFATNGTVAATIDVSQRFLIGATADNGSGAKLQVTGTTSSSGTYTSTMTNDVLLYNAASTATGYKYINISNNNGGAMQFGLASTTGVFATGSIANQSVFGNAANAPAGFMTNNTIRYAIVANGDHDFKSGAALFGGTFTISPFSTAGIVTNNSSGLLSTSTALPSGTTATTPSPADNSPKVATTAYVDAAIGGGGLFTPRVVGRGEITNSTTAQPSIATYTTGAGDESFYISANIVVTTSTTHSFSATCSYTDQSNTARVVTMNFSQLGGTFITGISNILGASAYEGVPLHIRAKAGTAVTIATTGTFTAVTYSVEALIERMY